MEPLSAFTVACNVLQVIEAGVKVFNKAVEYHSAQDGLTSDHQNLKNVAQSLRDLSADLQASLPKRNDSTIVGFAESRLIEANNECLRLSADFLVFLDQLKVHNPKAFLDVLRASIKSLWRRDRVAALERSVSQARDNLTVAFLIYMNSKQTKFATQDGLQAHTTKLEHHILQAVQSSSGYIQDDVRALSLRLDGLSLNHGARDAIDTFLTSHHDFLQLLSTQLSSILSMSNSQKSLQDETEAPQAENKIVSSLHFPQMDQRKERLEAPYEKTFRWIITDDALPERRWDHFLDWIRGTKPGDDKIYWIDGKPGSGKSSIVGFLDDNLDPVTHMHPWVEKDQLLQASYYFWSAGDSLFQKSITGMLRTILYKLLEQAPYVVPKTATLRRWRSARLASEFMHPWTDGELRETLEACITCIGENNKILLLLDGLDEIQDVNDAQDSLIQLIHTLATFPNVKICISSRPETAFLDAFGAHKRLRLQDLTLGDIYEYVNGQFDRQASFRNLRGCDPAKADTIVGEVIQAADGVFLWVRLVMKQLIRCMRDGNGAVALQQALRDIPRDLDAYFRDIMNSTEPEYRWEASVMLQLALWEEKGFVTLHGLRLLDISLVEKGIPDFAFLDGHRSRCLNFADPKAVQYRLDTAFRKLQSRCRGLLECYHRPGSIFNTLKIADSDEEDSADELTSHESPGTETKLSEVVPSALITPASDLKGRLYMFDFGVGFLHRSLRDFLLTPASQGLLERFSNGLIDERRLLVGMRLVQAYSAMEAGLDLQLVKFLASHIICGLAAESMQSSEHVLQLCEHTKPLIEALVAKSAQRSPYLYIDEVLTTWQREQSSFLTLSIDYRLDAYVNHYLNSNQVKSKPGRPLLDHALRPRFLGFYGMQAGLTMPDARLAAYITHLGADPNEMYEGSSVWSLYLCFLSDFVDDKSLFAQSTQCKQELFRPLEVMIRANAASRLPRSWLSQPPRQSISEPGTSGRVWRREARGDIEIAFNRRWGDLTPIRSQSYNMSFGDFYEVNDLLESFRNHYDDVDGLKHLLAERGSR